MMNFQECVDEVLIITARPDRTSEIQSRINATLSKCILKANFARDLVETTIAIDDTLYGDTIDISGDVTQFRKMKYVKPYGLKRYLTPIDSTRLFTPGATMQRDRYYLAGLDLTYTLFELVPSLEIGYYQYAPTLSSSDTHWFLDVAPWAIIDLTSAAIFRSIGDDTSAAQYEKSGTEFYNVAKRDFEDSILATAR
jgi:hypothetical protein